MRVPGADPNFCLSPNVSGKNERIKILSVKNINSHLKKNCPKFRFRILAHFWQRTYLCALY